MKSEEVKITLHMVSSLDGFVAKKDNSILWFDTSCNYENGVESEDAENFLNAIDCYIMGSRTYELAIELSKEYGWAYGDKPTIVLTKRNLSSDKPNIEFFSGNLQMLINDKLKSRYKNIWVAGGSSVAKDFIQQKLVNEIMVSILPIILGEGLPFFDQIGQDHPLELIDAKAYKNGMVELSYAMVK
jgi:dihydrofolate reductase